MRATATDLADVIEIEPKRYGDSRGYFSETFRADWFADHVSPLTFVQDNQSLSTSRGTVRGLHAQTVPFAQGKLVSCAAGAILDVAVDLRDDSDSFGRWVGVELSADRGNQLWIPPGFLHGFCTLTDNCLVTYKATNTYSRDNEVGMRWDDADLGIAWPDFVDPELMSERDRVWPSLRESQLKLLTAIKG